MTLLALKSIWPLPPEKTVPLALNTPLAATARVVLLKATESLVEKVSVPLSAMVTPYPIDTDVFASTVRLPPDSTDTLPERLLVTESPVMVRPPPEGIDNGADVSFRESMLY